MIKRLVPRLSDSQQLKTAIDAKIVSLNKDIEELKQQITEIGLPRNAIESRKAEKDIEAIIKSFSNEI